MAVTVKCKKCGLSVKKPTIQEAIQELSKYNCTFALGYRTWCACGEIDSFEVNEGVE